MWMFPLLTINQGSVLILDISGYSCSSLMLLNFTVSILEPGEVPTAFLHYLEKRDWSRPNPSLVIIFRIHSFPLPSNFYGYEGAGRVTCSAPINSWVPNSLHYGDLTHCTSLWCRASHTHEVQPQQRDPHTPPTHTHTLLHSSFLYFQPDYSTSFNGRERREKL